MLSSVAAIGGFLFGFDSGVINGAVDALANAFGTRAAVTGFAVASVLLGCAVGAFVRRDHRRLSWPAPDHAAERCFLSGQRIGDRRGWLGSAFHRLRGSPGGLAIGAASVLAPMYIAEVAPAHIRGPPGLAAANGHCAGAVQRFSEQ